MVAIDIVGSFVAQARTQPNVVALCGGRITGGRPRTKSADDPSGWQMPTTAIVFNLVDGPARQRQGRVPVRTTCVQVDCYGSDLRTASALYEQWYDDHFPTDNNTSSASPTGWITAHTAVISLEVVGSPIGIYEPQTAWPRVSATVMATHSEVAIP